MKTKKKTTKVVVELDHDANMMVQRKQLEIAESIGKKPNKSEAILILIKQ
jgi:hypothetical protein